VSVVSDETDETALASISGVDLKGPYHSLRVARVVDETQDARSIVLEVPDALRELFAYEAGQFLTFRFEVNGQKLVRCYSLASCPSSEREHKVTVKRIQDGRVSNWINDTLAAGHLVEVMRPAGLFTLRNQDQRIILFGGGSGITPCISIIKTALATTHRKVRLVYANRDEESVIFKAELANFEQRYPDRLEVVHRYDVMHGFADAAAVRGYVANDIDADFYICGPGPFMDVVQSTLLGLGVSPERVFIERFGSPGALPAGSGPARGAPVAAAGGDAAATITISLHGETREVAYTAGDTVLVTARKAGMEPPFACEEGYCGCCMAQVKEGGLDMKANDCLDRGQLEEGWVLTCQGVPRKGTLRIAYPD